MTHTEARAELEAVFIAIYRVMEREGGHSPKRSIEGIIAGLQQDRGDREAVLNAHSAFVSLARARPFSDYGIHREDPEAMRAENQMFSALLDHAGLLLRAARDGTLGAIAASGARGAE